jgi:hypothetical protein
VAGYFVGFILKMKRASNMMSLPVNGEREREREREKKKTIFQNGPLG